LTKRVIRAIKNHIMARFKHVDRSTGVLQDTSLFMTVNLQEQLPVKMLRIFLLSGNKKRHIPRTLGVIYLKITENK